MSDDSNQSFNESNIRPLGHETLTMHKRGDRIMLWAALAIAISTLVFAGVSARIKEPIVRDFGTVIEQRAVVIVEQEKRSQWQILDASSGVSGSYLSATSYRA